MEIFLGKSECCMMTAYSGAFDKKWKYYITQNR